MRSANRLRGFADLRRVRARGRRVSRPEFVLYHSPRDASGPPRVGLAVPRRVGSAVVRNRTKRKLREALRPLIPRLQSCDIVVAVRPPAASAGVAELEAALGEAVARAGLLRTDPDPGQT